MKPYIPLFMVLLLIGMSVPSTGRLLNDTTPPEISVTWIVWKVTDEVMVDFICMVYDNESGVSRVELYYNNELLSTQIDSGPEFIFGSYPKDKILKTDVFKFVAYNGVGLSAYVILNGSDIEAHSKSQYYNSRPEKPVVLNLFKKSTVSYEGKTFYVGGSGPNNYTKIQDAIDDANTYDTVFVYNDSSPYIENLVINTSIHLIGEDRNSTVIDGNEKGGVVKIFSNRVNINNFTIQNGVPTAEGSGIAVWSNYNSFYYNTISNNFNGIFLFSSTNNSIVDNNFANNIAIGIYSIYGSNNTIMGNNVIKNYAGIELDESFENKIYENNIQDNKVGFALDSSSSNIIHSNNIINNSLSAVFIKSLSNIGSNNLWNHNYWDKNRCLPKPILGFIETNIGIGSLSILIPWINFDWNPAQEPYDI